ncbi:MAG: hypothetical protein RIR48_1214 [Bacteroidota bacterium]|jgi:hypothetical protein
MKGVYLTEEGKKVIEDKIAELEKPLNKQPANIDTIHYKLIDAYKEILSSATILSVEESWKHIGHDSGVFWGTDADILLSMYPNGVIIQPKQ